MKNTKFKPQECAYLLKFGGISSTQGVFTKAQIRLIEIHIVNVGRDMLEGFNFENYGHIMKHYPHMVKNIYTKKNKRKGKEIAFEDIDNVAILQKYTISSLLTESEAKLKMIAYIANDFNEDVCVGCTHGQDESY